MASRGYLAARGVPRHPSDLAGHDCVIFTGFARSREWKLIGPDGPITVEISGRITSNDIDVMTDAAKQGLGIMVGATLAVGSALVSGDLVPVLSDYAFEPTAIFAVYPSARQLSTKVRAVVDFLAEALPEPPLWDRELAGKIPGASTVSWRASATRARVVSGSAPEGGNYASMKRIDHAIPRRT